MRGLTDEEREFVEYVFVWGGHHERVGPKSGLCSEDDNRLIDVLGRAWRHRRLRLR